MPTRMRWFAQVLEMAPLIARLSQAWRSGRPTHLSEHSQTQNAPLDAFRGGGGNNVGKTTILHGLAIWEFCRTAIEMERGPEKLLSTWAGQGIGLGDDEFSPINVPSLKHLWTNLRIGNEGEPDAGYTLTIRCRWKRDGAEERHLEFGLSLANDRLFVKPTKSNLVADDRVPRLAYLPPFAGMTDQEARTTGAIRRRRIGEGLAGAVLRNILLDLWERNAAERERLRGDKSKISDSDLAALRASDPWEILQQNLRETFGAELPVLPFREEYHSYIQVQVVKGTVDRFKLKRHSGYNPRDLMVEGSGFLQWLSVFALATDPELNLLLLDEPDAHLHSSLQEELLGSLRRVAAASGKQMLVATHSTEILRNAEPKDILHVRRGHGSGYLTTETQKVGMLAGLGSDYAPRVDRAKRTKRVLFVEGTSDLAVLKICAEHLGLTWPERWVEWTTAQGQKERKHVYLALKEEIPELWFDPTSSMGRPATPTFFHAAGDAVTSRATSSGRRPLRRRPGSARTRSTSASQITMGLPSERASPTRIRRRHCSTFEARRYSRSRRPHPSWDSSMPRPSMSRDTWTRPRSPRT